MSAPSRAGRDASLGEREPQRGRGQRRFDLALGILLGVVLGIGVIAAFVFLGSEGSIDAPRISNGKIAPGSGHGSGTTAKPRTAPPSPSQTEAQADAEARRARQ